MQQLVSEHLSKTESIPECAHCGDVCSDTSIAIDNDHFFCCHGCKTVFEILHENGLEAYYNLDANPGITLKKSKPTHYYDFLDNDDVKRRLLDFDSPKVSKVHFYIPSIHCSSCIWLLENLHQLTKGVEYSRVNFPKKEVNIDFDPSVISLRALVEMMATLGYEPDISLEKEGDKSETKSRKSRQLLVKLGVAGFAFGNIMLFSFPEYLGIEELFDLDFKKFFGYINLFFSLPVIFYCSTDYFVSAWKGLRNKYVNIDVPISIGILALFLRSSYEVISATGAGYFDSLAGLLFFLLLGKWFQNRTYESLLFDRNYKSYFPIAITRIDPQNGKQSVTIDKLEEGDKILIRNNELIPADSILLSKEALIDNSFVTGESTPISYNQGDYVYAGGKQVGAGIELEIKKPVSQSYLTQLWNNEAFRKEESISTHILVNKVSKYFTLIVLAIATLSGLYWYFVNPEIALNAFTAVLIVACPCALALATPFSTGTAMRIFGKRGFFVRNGDVIENMAVIDHVVLDKTGTMTRQDGEDVSFNGNMNEDQRSMVYSMVVHSTHPLSQKIAGYLVLDSEQPLSDYEPENFQEIPGKGLSGRVNGYDLQIGSADFTSAGADHKELHKSQVFVKVENKILGSFQFTHHYREGIERVIHDLSKDYKVSVLSGDNEQEKKYLSNLLPENSEILFNQSPYSKLESIERWRNEDQKVAMFGDGLNDAGALAKSNVGIAVTDEVGNFTPASDVIMRGDLFDNIPGLFKFSKSTKKVIISSFIISFLYNITGLSFAVAGKLEPLFAAILMPLSSISVVVFATIMVNFAAKRLDLH